MNNRKNKKVRKRVNYKNIWLMVVFVCSCGLIINDLCNVICMVKQFTLFGILTHILAWYWAKNIGEYFYEKLQ